MGYVLKNECENCELPRVQKSEMHPLTDDKLRAFQDKIKGHPFETIYFVALFTGMREGEILGLQWDGVDLKNGRITVQRQLQRKRIHGSKGIYELTTSKNGKTRTIRPAPQVMEALSRLKEKQNEEAKQNAGKWHNDWNLVFTNELGQHLVERTILRKFKIIVDEMGIPETVFHDLRHSFATLSLQNGDDIKTLSMTLGNATTAFTMDRYGHVSESMEKESAERMRRFIDAGQNIDKGETRVQLKVVS